MSPVEKSERLGIRLDARERGMLAELAKDADVSVSDAVRLLIATSYAKRFPARGAKAASPEKKLEEDLLGTGARRRERALDGVTVVHDLASNTAIQRIAGVVVLPLGAEIELVKPNINARVERVRLLAGDVATVCLDVRLPK